MSVENSPLESSEYDGPQFLHVTGQKHDVDCSRNQVRNARKTAALPRDDGLWLDDDECRAAVAKDTG